MYRCKLTKREQHDIKLGKKMGVIVDHRFVSKIKILRIIFQLIEHNTRQRFHMQKHEHVLNMFNTHTYTHIHIINLFLITTGLFHGGST